MNVVQLNRFKELGSRNSALFQCKAIGQIWSSLLGGDWYLKGRFFWLLLLGAIPCPEPSLRETSSPTYPFPQLQGVRWVRHVGSKWYFWVLISWTLAGGKIQTSNLLMQAGAGTILSFLLSHSRSYSHYFLFLSISNILHVINTNDILLSVFYLF